MVGCPFNPQVELPAGDEKTDSPGYERSLGGSVCQAEYDGVTTVLLTNVEAFYRRLTPFINFLSSRVPFRTSNLVEDHFNGKVSVVQWPPFSIFGWLPH